MPHRFSMLALGLVLGLAGCAGGWTGEITMLGACNERVDDGDPDEIPALLDQLGRTRTVDVEWEADSFATGETQLSAEVVELAPASLIGGPGCEHPFVSMPVRLHLESADGAIDTELEGTVAHPDEATLYLTTTIPAAAMGGAGTLPATDGTVRVDLTWEALSMTGMVMYQPPTEDTVVLSRF